MDLNKEKLHIDLKIVGTYLEANLSHYIEVVYLPQRALEKFP